MRKLSGRTVLVTGGTGRTGRAVASALAARGMRPAIAGRDASVVERATEAVPGSAGIVADLNDPDGPRRMAHQARSQLGAVDVVVHVAGMDQPEAFEQLDAPTLVAQLQLNLGAPLQLTRLLLPSMLRRHAGHVVFVGTLSGLLSGAYQVPYAAAGAGIDAAARALRLEHRGSGVGFSAVHPAPISDSSTYQQRLSQAGQAPIAVGRTSTRGVGAAVVRAICKNRTQLIVGSPGARPMLALRAVSPRTADWIVNAIGTTRYFARLSSTAGDSRSDE